MASEFEDRLRARLLVETAHAPNRPDLVQRIEAATTLAPAPLRENVSRRRWILPIAAAAAVVAVATAASVIGFGRSSSSGPAGPAVSPSSSAAPTVAPTTAADSPASSAAPTSTAPTSQNPTPTTPPTTSAALPPPVNGSGTPTPTSATGDTCPTGDLTLTTGTPNGAAGSSYTPVYLRNIGTATCTLQGFPGLTLLDSTGAPVAAPATREGAAGPTVSVAPGARVQFTVRTNNVTQTGCDTPRIAAQARIYPPNNTVAVVIPFDTSVCVVSVSTVTQ